MPFVIGVKRVGHSMGMCHFELTFDDVNIRLDKEEMQELYEQMKEEVEDQ